ncbi:MAG: N-acetyltransferase [Actinomycetales bacterium]|nr:MAG: N-acetyltransferase [Actinomycetales bacterium]
MLSFTGHAVLAVSAQVTDAEIDAWGADGFGGAHDPRLISALAGDGAWIDSLDALLVARGTGLADGSRRLVPRPDLAAHPRALFASGVRDEVAVLGYPDDATAIATVSRGVGGLHELSFEVEPRRRGGAGRQLVQDALSSLPLDTLVVAAVAPGNAASLRTLLAAGFAPIGSMQLFRRADPRDEEER